MTADQQMLEFRIGETRRTRRRKPRQVLRCPT